MVAASVTRRPAANSDLMPSRLSISPIYLRAAAMHHHRIDGGLLQQHDVAGKAARRRLLPHGMAAIFHDDGLVVVLLHMGQRLREDAGGVERSDVIMKGSRLERDAFKSKRIALATR